MKHINQTYTEEEYEQLKNAKGKQTWHDFILQLIKR